MSLVIVAIIKTMVGIILFVRTIYLTIKNTIITTIL